MRWLPSIFCGLVLASALPAEEPGPTLELALAESGYAQFTRGEESPDTLAAIWGCVLRYADLELYADSLVIWMQKADDDAGYKVAQVYAEGEPACLIRGLAGGPPGALPGDPRVEERAIYQLAESRLFLDLLNGRGLALEAVARGLLRTDDREVPLQVRAEEIRLLGEGRLEARDAVLSTCEFGDPHWRFHPRQVVVSEGRTGQTRRITASDSTVEIGRVPVLYVPWIAGELGRRGLGRRVPLQRVKAGRSSPFGAFLETDWGGDLPVGLGAWTVELDGYTRRGLGVGLDLVTEVLEGRGLVDTYLLPDDQYEDPRFPDRERDVRGRVRVMHRQPLGQRLRLDLELSYLSDRSFLEEYFEEEAKTGKAQETLGYLRWRQGPLLGTALGKVRINDFDTVTQYLPQVTLDVASAALLEGWITYDMRGEVARLERRYDEALDLDTPRIDRVDTYHVLGLPLHLGPVGVELLGGVRYSGFSETRRDDGWDDRVAGLAGVRAALNVHRIYDVEVPALDVHQLRHIITPQVAYEGVFGIDLVPERLHFFDEVDLVEDLHLVRIGLLNRLQTRAPAAVVDQGDDGRLAGGITDVLWLDVEALLNADGRPEVFGGLDVDLTCRIRDGLAVVGELRLGSGSSPDLDELALGVDWHQPLGLSRDEAPVERYLDVYLGHRHRGEVASVTTLDAEARIDARWGLRGVVQHDWEAGRLSAADLSLRRYLHDFVVTLGVGWDDGEDNLDVSLGVTLQDLDPEGRRSYHPGFEPYLDHRERSRLGRRAQPADQNRAAALDLVEPVATEETEEP
jgi:hypothetical protein